MSRGLVLGVALPVAVLALLLCSLIVLPAPTYGLFMVSVGVAEWSFWFVVLGAVTLLAGLVGWRANQVAAALLLLVSLGTICCAALPIVTAWQAARAAGVGLSLGRYIWGYRADPAIREQRDVPFVDVNGQTLRLDVYQPPQAAPAAPYRAVVVIHGGSWRSGDKGDYVQFNRWLAAGQSVVFDVQYRLADGKERFPAQVADVKCAIGWVKRNAAQYGIDPDRIAVLGRSAGAQLALLAAYTPNDPALPASCPAADTGVRAVVSFYGPTDLAWGYDHPAHPDVLNGPLVLENYLGGSPTAVPQQYHLAAPIDHVAGAVPSLFLHGGHDQLVGHQHVDRLLPLLGTVGVPAEYVFLPWANHAFDYNFNGWGSQLAQQEVARFLDSYLR